MVIKEIPGTLGFKVSEDGVVYDPDNQVRTQYVNGDGYRTASVKLLDGRWQTFGVHRLVALAHLPTDKDVTQLTVNHIDHDISNNDVDNLEWVTVYLNNLHASLMRTQVEYPTIIMTNAEGEKSFVNNLHDACAVLNVDIDLAWAMVRDGFEIDGIRLEAFTNRTAIPQELHRPTFVQRDAYGRSIQVMVVIKDLETGRCEKFDSMADAALRHGVSPSHIFQCVSREGKIRLFKKRYLIVRGCDPFPDVSPEMWENLRASGGRDTIARNNETNVSVVFPSASSMINMLGLSKKAVTTRLKRDGYGEVGPWFFCYLKNLEELKDRIQSSSSPCP